MPTLSRSVSSSSSGASLRPVQLALRQYLPPRRLEALVAATDRPGRRRVYDPGQVLWAGRLVSLHLVDSISDEAVRLALQKRGSSLGKRPSGASPR